MGIILQLYRSSVGKKLTAGLTGLFLCVYLVVHVIGNLLLFKCDKGAAFNAYADFLPSLLFIRIIEWVLFAIFLLHGITGTYLWFLNKRSRPEKYIETHPGANSTLTSRTMFLTSSIVFIFLVVHMRSFWFPARFSSGEDITMYDRVLAAFSDPVYSLFYVGAMVLLAFHLRHGFQSMFQTFGLRNQKYTGLIEGFGVIFWLLIPAAFASMPVYFFSQSCHWFH